MAFCCAPRRARAPGTSARGVRPAGRVEGKRRGLAGTLARNAILQSTILTSSTECSAEYVFASKLRPKIRLTGAARWEEGGGWR